MALLWKEQDNRTSRMAFHSKVICPDFGIGYPLFGYKLVKGLAHYIENVSGNFGMGIFVHAPNIHLKSDCITFAFSWHHP